MSAPSRTSPAAPTPYDQDGFAAKLRWGLRGAERASELGEILVVVDVLSFSTAVCRALDHGVEVFPAAPGEGPARAEELGAQLAVKRGQIGPSLSPGSLEELEPGTRLVLPSPNGSACSRAGAGCEALLLGALVNASAAARRARELHEETGRPVSVLACGERWKEPRGEPLRVALEDALGAGAVLAGLDLPASPEATHAILGFQAQRDRLESVLLESGSGRELVERGYPQDVEVASALDTSSCVPRLRGDRFVRDEDS